MMVIGKTLKFSFKKNLQHVFYNEELEDDVSKNEYTMYFGVGELPECSSFYVASSEFSTAGIYLWFWKFYFSISVHPTLFEKDIAYNCTLGDKLPFHGFVKH